MTRRWTAISLIWLASWLIASSHHGDARSIPAGLSLRAPASVYAGEALDVAVAGVIAGGPPVHLAVTGSYGTAITTAEAATDELLFGLPPAETTVAGVVTLTATQGSAVATAHVEIVPGAPIEPLKPLIGARTIVADGVHWSMVVVIPFDRFGNPVAPGTDVEIRAVNRGGRPNDAVVQVDHLLAWRRIVSGTVAGRTTIAVRSGDAVGPEGSIDEVAGWPVAFAITASAPSLPADGQSQLLLRTGTLVDEFGNVLLDGTLVTFIAEGAEGLSRIPAVTIGGIAEVPLRAPVVPGVMTVHAVVFDVASAPITIDALPGPAVGEIGMMATIDANAGVIVVSAGPVLGALAEYVPDGTEVTIALSGAGGRAEAVATVDGGSARVEFRLDQFQPGEYTVSAKSGTGSGETRVTVPQRASATLETPAPVASPVATPLAVR